MSVNRFFNAVRSADNLTLSIYDAIGADMFGQGITAAQVQDALQGDHKTVTVRVNSPGGDAMEGVTIYNLLASSKKPVNVIVDGLAASAASIIAMAGETITMNEGSMMMIHDAIGIGMGNSDEMRKLADTLDSVTSSIADIYVSNTGLSKDAVLKMMSDETWMSGAEAKQNGFCTAIGKGAKVSNSFDLSKFKNTPKELLNVAKTKRVDGEDLTSEDFIYAGNPHDASTWSLPWKFSTDELTKSHLRDALARFSEDEVIPKAMRPEAHAKLERIAKQHGIDVSNSTVTNSAETVVEDFVIALMQKQLESNRRK